VFFDWKDFLLLGYENSACVRGCLSGTNDVVHGQKIIEGVEQACAQSNYED
jgi:hypothetical protein